jgi:arylsulfatase
MMAGGKKAKVKGEPSLRIELYNLKTDPSETKDVSAEHPEVVAQIAKVMRDQHTPNPDFPFPAID